jgi:hypothetical protein
MSRSWTVPNSFLSLKTHIRVNLLKVIEEHCNAGCRSGGVKVVRELVYGTRADGNILAEARK